MPDFETVIGRLQSSEGLDRGAAIARLKELNEDGQVPEGKVSGLSEGLIKERAKSVGGLAGEGIIRGLTDIPSALISHIPGMENITGARDALLQNIQSNVEPTKYVEGAGELVGGAAAYGAPFEAVEEGIGLAVPKLAGPGIIPTSVRRAISGGILGGASTGTMEGAKTWAKYGVILPPVIDTALSVLGGVGGIIGAKLGDMLSRAGQEADVEPEFRHVEEQKLLEGPPTIEGPVRTPFQQDFVAYPPKTGAYVAPEEHLTPKDVPIGPVDKKPTTINGEVKPEAAFVKPPEPKLSEAEMRAKIKSDLAIRSKVAKAKAKGASDAALAEAGVHDLEAGKAPAGSVFNPIKRKSPDVTPGTYVGTRDVTTGQPFEGTTTVHLQSNNGDVYINRTNPNADLGQPRPVSLKNPAVVMVPGNAPYREALAKLFPESPHLLEAYDRAEEPDATAREALGRFIKKKGYDGLILKTDDVSKDVIVDFKNFIAPQEYVGAPAIPEPPKGVFARALKFGDRDYEPNLSTPSFGGDSYGDPYVERRAIKYNGRVFEGVSPNDYHLDIINRHPEIRYVNAKTDRGFIGHDGKYYSQNELNQKIDAYIRRYGHPTPGDKVDFSDLVGFKRSMQPGVMYDLGKPEDLNTVVKDHGFTDAPALARAIRASKFTPFEMFQNMAKAEAEPPPLTRANLLVTHADAKVVEEPIRALTNRYPKLTGVLDQIRLTHNPEAPWLARTGMIPGTNKIAMEVNTAFLPDRPAGQEIMGRFKFQPHQGQEYITTTLEHELTHAAQFWLDNKKLGQVFGSPNMNVEASEDPRIEAQAENRDRALQGFFDSHEDLRKRVAAVPEEVRVAALKAHGAEERAKLRPTVRRKFNQLANIHSVKYFDRKIPKPTTVDFENMDAFDAATRGGPIDSQIDPDQYYSPEVKSMLGAMQKAGMKWGGWFASIRNPWDVTDNEDHQWFIARVFQLAREMHVEKAKFNKQLGSILTEYGAEDKNYDKLWEAVEGLRRAPDGSLSQTVPDVDPKTAKAAVKIREQIFDPAYTHITGIDRKAPAIIKSLNLPDTKEQWTRLKQLQTGQRAQVKNPTLDEFSAAQKTEGMLNFDESHDLRGEYVDGYITHQPIANERAELLNQIAQVDKIAELTGVTDPTGQALRASRVKRLQEIELELAKSYVRGKPRTDVLPDKHYFGPTLVKDHPGAASVVVDKNIPQIAGRYVNGIVSKRYFDQVLHEFSKISKTLPGSVRDYNITYINNLRGLRGFGEDAKLVAFLNDVSKKLEKVGVNTNRVSINDVRKAGDFAVKLQTFTKLLATPIRFPLVQLTHLMMTTWPAAGSQATARGLAYFFSHPRQAVLEAMARGVIERDADFLGAMDSITPTTQGALLKYSQVFTKFSDYFRKAVSWHTFRLQAMEPGFKPSPMAKTFIKDVPGRGTIGMARDYADAMTDRTQFRLRAEGKPTAFVGGQVRRAVTQFKPWMVNYGTFFKDVLKSGDPGMQARLFAALYFVGGPTAVLGGDLVYNYARTELIKHFGYVLPNDTGFQQIANHLGWGSTVGDIDLLSLRSPVGIPSDMDNVLPWMAGPTLGTLWDVGKGIHDAKGDTGKEIKSTLSAISPEARALLDAGEEWRQGGVKSSMGEILARRPATSVIIRGLDLSPSVKSQRYNYRNDIITALQSGHPDTARQLLAQAKNKGIIFGPKDMRQIRSTVTHYLKGQKLYEKDPEAMLR